MNCVVVKSASEAYKKKEDNVFLNYLRLASKSFDTFVKVNITAYFKFHTIPPALPITLSKLRHNVLRFFVVVKSFGFGSCFSLGEY